MSNHNTENGDTPVDSAFSLESQNERSITPEHLKEWVEGSGVDEELTRLNVESIAGEDVFVRLYPHADRKNGGRLTDKFLKKHEKLQDVHGWWVEPIDPTLGVASGWGQFKADSGSPLSDVKYRAPAGESTLPAFLKVPSKIASEIAERGKLKYDSNQEFWQWFLSQKPLPLTITEGAKKAGSLLTNYVPTVALPGVWNAYTKLSTQEGEVEILHDWLREACDGRDVFIVFDTDPKSKTRRDVNKAKVKLAQMLLRDANPKSVSFINIPAPFGTKMGIDDYILKGGDLHLLFEKAIDFKDWINPAKSGDWNRQLRQMDAVTNGCLRLNKLTNEVEMNGDPVDWNTLVGDYAEEVESHTYGRDRFNILALKTAKKHSYHPVRDYLDSLLPSDYDLDKIAVKYFGSKPGSLQCRMVRKWLISAVARIYKPGCKVDSALILFDPIGGIGKSSWFRYLCAVSTWFCDDMGSPEDKDQLLKMHQHWIIEWAELDFIMGHKNDSAIKSSISCSADNIRPPYGRSTVKMPRQSVLCGTTNKREFLFSKGGDRRYWVLSCKDKIPFELLEEERDLIWASAKAAFESGESWHLTREEQQELSKELDTFRYKSPEQELIEEYLESLNGQTKFLTKDMMFKLDISTADRKFPKMARQILEELGWKKGVVRINGERKNGYEYLPEGVIADDEKRHSTSYQEGSAMTVRGESCHSKTSYRHSNNETAMTPSNVYTEANTEGVIADIALTKESSKNAKSGKTEYKTIPAFSENEHSEGKFETAMTAMTAMTPTSEMAQLLNNLIEAEDYNGAKETLEKFLIDYPDQKSQLNEACFCICTIFRRRLIQLCPEFEDNF